jgi:glucose/galactose transporter
MNQTASQNAPSSKSPVLGMVMIGVLFFIFGFITWANSQLIPYLKLACELSPAESYLVATAFFAAYFVMALPSAAILQRTGYQKGMSLGLGIMAVGAVLFIPAAQSRTFSIFLLGLFVIGTGLALLQTASNPYAAALGPQESAARRISIMGICNKVAGILSVYILGSITLSNADAIKTQIMVVSPAEKAQILDTLAHRVIVPYEIIAASLAVLAIAFLLVKLPPIPEEDAPSIPSTSGTSPVRQLLSHRNLVLGALALFLYVGVEVISYDTFAAFGESLGYPLDVARRFASYTGYCLLAGYVFGIALIPTYLSQQKALVYSAVLSLVLVCVALVASGPVAVGAFALLGFSQAAMWPAIFPMALSGLGRLTKTGSAILIMAIVGGAVLPPLYGTLSEAIHNPQLAYALMLPCYGYILWFALQGQRAAKKAGVIVP